MNDPYRVVEVDDNLTVLEENPEAAYGKAKREGNLAYAVVSLADIRDDWFAWMAYKLCRNDDQLDMPTASVVVSLAAIRRPVEPSQVVEWLAEWLKEPSGVEDVLNRLLKDGNVQTKDGPIEAVRNLNGQLQFISTNTWPIPKLETK